MNEFVIPFFGLKTGTHKFDFKIGREFFEAFESKLIEAAKIDVDLELEKTKTMLILYFDAKGNTTVPCDRCGDDFELPLEASERVIVKFGDETFDQTDEIIVLPHEAHEIDVSQRIYEMLILNLPNKRVHPDISDCNQEVIEKLNEINSKENKEHDPRWDALKKLK